MAVAWGAVEILLTLQERLGWPEWIAKLALGLFVAGFPLVLIGSWFRDIEGRVARALILAGAFAIAGTALWLTLDSEAPAPDARLPVSETVATVAVLDFENLAGDPALDYLVEGFTGDLIARLSKHPDLAVIQKESLESPLLANLLPAAQAAALSTDFFVTGGLRRQDKFLEVTARLQDAAGTVLWSETGREPYTAEKVATLQRRISGEVSRSLGVRLGAPEFCGETADLEAMELYYQGRRRVLQRRRENIEAGIDVLKQAVDKDPYFGRAWNVLGDGYLSLPGWIMDPKESDEVRATSHPMALAAFRRALDICPTLGWAYKVTVPPYEGVDNEWLDQEMQWRDALAMDPNDGGLLRQYSFHLLRAGMISGAVAATRRGYDNDPLMASVIREHAWALMNADRCDEALALEQRAEELGGSQMRFIRMNCADDPGALVEVLSHQNAQMGGQMMQMMGLDLGVAELAEAWFDPASPAGARLLSQLEAMWASEPSERNPMNNFIVGTGIQLGALDFVFGVLDTLAHDRGIAGLMMSRGTIWNRGTAQSEFRADPRFPPLMERIGLREYWETYGWPDRCEPTGDGFRCS